MALEWIGNLARKINSVMTTPSQQATQLAEQLGENNPYRLQIGSMTGTPPANVLQQAANWDTNTRDFNSRTLPVGPETFANSDQNNQLAKILGQNQGRYDLNIVNSAFNTDEQLKKQAQQTATIQKLVNLSQEDRQLLQTTPEGRNALTLADTISQNPEAFGLETVVKAYTGSGQLAGDITAAQTTRQQLQAKKNELLRSVDQLPSDLSKLKELYVSRISNATSDSELEAVTKELYQYFAPKDPLSPKDIAEINWRNSETWRNYNVLPEKSGGDVNFWSGFGFGSSKDASAFATGLEKAYAAEAKNNGGKLDVDGNWTFPTGKPMPSINNWIKKNYGENELRRYKAVKTSNQDYLDTSRSLTGIQTPGLIQNDWDLAADKLVTQFGSFAKARNYAVTNRLDKRLINALDRRKKILDQRK